MLSKNEFKFNYNKTKNLSFLSKVGSGLSAVVLNLDNLDINVPINYKIQDFFNIIITSNKVCLDKFGADICINTNCSPYKNSVLDLNIFEHKNTIFVLNDDFINVLCKAKINLLNFVVSYCLADTAISNKPLAVNNILNGISKQDPELHILSIMGITNIMIDLNDINEFINKRTKFKTLANIKYKNRNNFIND